MVLTWFFCAAWRLQLSILFTLLHPLWRIALLLLASVPGGMPALQTTVYRAICFLGSTIPLFFADGSACLVGSPWLMWRSSRCLRLAWSAGFGQYPVYGCRGCDLARRRAFWPADVLWGYPCLGEALRLASVWRVEYVSDQRKLHVRSRRSFMTIACQILAEEPLRLLVP